MRPVRRRYTVSQIVATVYCEQQVVFDRRFGKVRSADVARKAARGTFEHRRFEVEGYTRSPAQLLRKMGRQQADQARPAAADTRCFIASQIYGPAAAQTDCLRAWRDRVLLPCLAGRLVVRAYYSISPVVVALTRTSPRLARLTRRALDAFLRRIGSGQ
jgi:hypothetical protein